LWVVAKKLVVKDLFLCSSLYIITVVNGGNNLHSSEPEIQSFYIYTFFFLT
jgi:hypothetical protein